MGYLVLKFDANNLHMVIVSSNPYTDNLHTIYNFK